MPVSHRRGFGREFTTRVFKTRAVPAKQGHDFPELGGEKPGHEFGFRRTDISRILLRTPVLAAKPRVTIGRQIVVLALGRLSLT